MITAGPRLLSASLAIAALAWTQLDASPPIPAGRPRIVARAGEVAVALHSTAVTRTASHLVAASGLPAPKSRTQSIDLVVEFQLASRSADALAGVVSGPLGAPIRFRAIDDRGKLHTAAAAEVRVEEETHRLRVHFRGIPPAVTSLRSVEGALSAYPRARRVRFHVPWTKEDLPVSVEYEGARATLRRFHLVGDETTLWVAIRPPEGMGVAPPDRPGHLAARAMDIYGNLVSGGAITETLQTQSGPEPEFRFFAPVLRRIPSRLMLDVLCVSGEPQPIPFKTAPIQLEGARGS